MSKRDIFLVKEKAIQVWNIMKVNKSLSPKSNSSLLCNMRKTVAYPKKVVCPYTVHSVRKTIGEKYSDDLLLLPGF